MKHKIVYIAHPVGGDVKTNLDKVATIARVISIKERHVIPVAPYYLMCHALDDNNPEERKLGMEMTLAYIKYAKVTELRLYGNKISAGMWKEIELAEHLGIKIIPCTEETKLQLLTV